MCYIHNERNESAMISRIACLIAVMWMDACNAPSGDPANPDEPVIQEKKPNVGAGLKPALTSKNNPNIRAGFKPAPKSNANDGNSPVRVGIIGDSIAHGGDAVPFGEILEDLLQKAHGEAVVDTFAVPGETTEEIGSRLSRDILSKTPEYDTVLIQGGTNDLFIGFKVNTIKRHFESMIRQAVAEERRVVVVTVPPAWGYGGWTREMEDRRLALNRWLQALPNVEVADVAGALSVGEPARMKDEYVGADPIHPNDAGQNAMAHAVYGSVFRSPWRTVAKGTKYRVYTDFGSSGISDRRLHVVRVTPRKARISAFAKSKIGGPSRTAKEWCEKENLAVVINAGMYREDHSTHVGYFRDSGHVNAAKFASKYHSALVFGPLAKSLRAADIVDIETPEDRDALKRYRTVVQNLRLIQGSGKNVWKRQPRQWSEAAVAVDKKGRLLFVFSRSPYSMHDFNRQLLQLPLGVERAQHLEGGPEASLSIHGGGVHVDLNGSFETGFVENDDELWQWPIPNIIGVHQ